MDEPSGRSHDVFLQRPWPWGQFIRCMVLSPWLATGGREVTQVQTDDERGGGGQRVPLYAVQHAEIGHGSKH